MTPAQAAAIAASDNATLAILNALVSFLEKQGVLSRQDFAAFLEAAITGWREEGMNAQLLSLIEIKVQSLEASVPPSVQN
jgi:hypothetical protein